MRMTRRTGETGTKGARFIVSVPDKHIDEVERMITELEDATKNTASRVVLDAVRDYHKRMLRRERRSPHDGAEGGAGL